MTEIAEPQTAPGTIVSLPLVGPTTVEDAVFYGVLGVVTAVKLVSWPTAALIGSAHALHQRARNHKGIERGELLEGALEATEGLL
jgi:hypothetical protein